MNKLKVIFIGLMFLTSSFISNNSVHALTPTHYRILGGIGMLSGVGLLASRYIPQTPAFIKNLSKSDYIIAGIIISGYGLLKYAQRIESQELRNIYQN